MKKYAVTSLARAATLACLAALASLSAMGHAHAGTTVNGRTFSLQGPEADALVMALAGLGVVWGLRRHAAAGRA